MVLHINVDVLCTPCAGPTYFEYIGTGDICGAPTLSSSCSNSDTTPQLSTVRAVPRPSSAPFYFIVFVLTDQLQIGKQTPSGISTGNFAPLGSYAATANPNAWDGTQIANLVSVSGGKV